MAAAQQAAYNQRVLEGLKSFSGEYTSGTSHWDELVCTAVINFLADRAGAHQCPLVG